MKLENAKIGMKVQAKCKKACMGRSGPLVEKGEIGVIKSVNPGCKDAMGIKVSWEIYPTIHLYTYHGRVRKYKEN